MSVLAPKTKLLVLQFLRNRYRSGPNRGDDMLMATNEMVSSTVDVLSQALKEDGSPIILKLETIPVRSKRDYKICGVIARTERLAQVINIKVTASLVRIGANAVYVSHQAGAEDLLNTIDCALSALQGASCEATP